MEPLISVIMPVYNAEATLGRALASLEAQTLGFDALELIIADDRSADRSPLLIGEFARAHNNVKTALMSRNSGFAGAPRNAATGSPSKKIAPSSTG